MYTPPCRKTKGTKTSDVAPATCSSFDRPVALPPPCVHHSIGRGSSTANEAGDSTLLLAASLAPLLRLASSA